MKPPYATIRQKLARIILTTSTVVLLLTSVAFFAYEYYSYRESIRDQLLTIGRVIAGNSTSSLMFDDSGDANEILEALKGEQHILAAAIYDSSGHIFAWYPSSLRQTQLPAAPGANEYHFANGRLLGFQPIEKNGKRLGTLFLQSDTELINNRFQLYLSVAFLVFLFSFIIAYLLSKRLQRTISRPILDLANLAENISKRQDYSVRAKKFYNDELGVLTDAFNDMLERIQVQNAEITSFNHALEQKVADRTNDLEKANAELRLNNDFVKAIIDSSIDVIAVFDCNLHYVILNKYAKELYGVEEQDVIGKHILDVFPLLTNGPMYNDLQQALLGTVVHNPVYKSRISDRLLENFYIPLVDKENKVYSVLVIGHDITQIFKANEKLSLLNDALERSNKDLEQFAYVASHDLQEPLRKIHTFSALLEKKLDDKEAATKYMSKIISSAGRMSSLIKSVLNYSQLSNEKRKFEQVDLNEVIEVIKTDFELTIAEKEAIIYSDPLPILPGNRLQLNQLFFNLFSNALKFTRQQPVIHITAATVQKSEVDGLAHFNAAGPYACIAFSDNGIGFEQRYADKIFSVFQRLHTREEYPGTGIGLALCKKIIDNHHGQITVNSQPGKGTTFTIYLPLTVQLVEGE